jgi:uncharacterized protein with HEPN domain
MRPEERDAASLWDALQAARRISRYVGGLTFDGYLSSDITRAAVERELTIISEALTRLSPEAKQTHPELALAGIRGLRNRIIHDYENLEQRTIFGIATERIPELVEQLTAALPPTPPDPEPE